MDLRVVYIYNLRENHSAITLKKPLKMFYFVQMCSMVPEQCVAELFGS